MSREGPQPAFILGGLSKDPWQWERALIDRKWPNFPIGAFRGVGKSKGGGDNLA